MSKKSVSSIKGKIRGSSRRQRSGVKVAKSQKIRKRISSPEQKKEGKGKGISHAALELKKNTQELKAFSKVNLKLSSRVGAKRLGQVQIFGVNLGGGKAGRTWVAQFDLFSNPEKLFLRKIHENVDGVRDGSSDASLLKILQHARPRTDLVAFNVPLQLPKCLRCRLSCPGYERCKLPEISWLRKNHQQYRAKKRPQKLFTPYTQRCVEQYVATSLEEPFFPGHALGSNLAPLTARVQYLMKHLKAKVIEAMPSVSTWRLGQGLRVGRSQLRNYHHSTEGEVARRAILQCLVSRNLIFIYEQDVHLLEQNIYAFDAFITGLTAYYFHKKKCEDLPKGFPKTASWIAIPRVDAVV
jgi:hypothetical protein